MVRHKITEAELAKIVTLVEVGKTDQEIAEALGWTKDLADAPRAVSKQRRKLKLHRNVGLMAGAKEKTKLLEVMTKEERFDFIKSRINTNPRNRLVFQSFSQQEEACFLNSYYDVIQSTDSLTEAEEQQLFAAMVEYVLAFRALSMKSDEERCVQETLAGKHEKDNPRYRLHVDKRYSEEYDKHLENYQSLLNNLKMSRKQRLDKVKSDRRSLIDVAAELTNQNAQTIAADEIERLSQIRDDELKRLLDAGHIAGLFESK